LGEGELARQPDYETGPNKTTLWPERTGGVAPNAKVQPHAAPTQLR
jgi:hypothetical protein